MTGKHEFRYTGSKPKRKVYVRVTFKRMGEINTTRECFEADIVVNATWREKSFDGEPARENIKLENLWNPRIIVTNLISEIKEKTVYNLSTVSTSSTQVGGKAYLVMHRSIKGVFLENLELQDFPFDIQDLKVTLSTELSGDDVVLLEDLVAPSLVSTEAFVDVQEWNLWSDVYVESGETEETLLSSVRPWLKFKCTAERRYQSFLWNWIFIMAFIFLMSFTVFTVDLALTANRLQLSFILLLTTVSFRTNVNNSLPRFTYLTLLDAYLLGTWVVLCMMASWHAFAGKFLDMTDDMRRLDVVVTVFFMLVYICFHTGYYLLVKHRIEKRKKFLQTKIHEINSQKWLLGSGLN